MLKILLLMSLASAPIAVFGQDKLDSVERFIDDSETIVIANAVEVGPVNIIGLSRVRLEILHIVKGVVKEKELSLSLRPRIKVGGMYLVSIAKAGPDRKDRDVVIEVHEPENIELLKTLSPRIVVLRTINIQLGRLDSIVRSAQYEIDELMKIKTTN
ncbi:MAG TPA: hypothetical protein PKA82_10755 [Pyrinomonadaceae bacterium]|nr:hypothetical protein [Pyrinomonadaceae bacterium]